MVHERDHSPSNFPWVHIQPRTGGPRDPSRAVDHHTGRTGARGRETGPPKLRRQTTEPSTDRGLDNMLWKLVGQGSLARLAHIHDVEVESLSIESIHVVSKFREVFPIDLRSMPPDRDINFCIELETNPNPISIPPYRMALAELRELKAQIQELIDKGSLLIVTSIDLEFYHAYVRKDSS
ncbi:hypothetical protein MTR67_039553 [Solanum verrucosum]|uniref:Uncharacterized protein n=1 Tax=Solanum verrucosum TaxID=315347 RepID=A0AAF0UIN3_SOLVR|nr:hypothetical protein MTR67_039553 [Solanum verrucosum]